MNLKDAIKVFEKGKPDPSCYTVLGDLEEDEAYYDKACDVLTEAAENGLRHYQIGMQDAAERLALRFEHFGHERAAADIREEAAKWSRDYIAQTQKRETK